MAGIRKSVGQVTLTDFRKAIKAGESFPCVLLMGPEEYLRQKDAEQYIESLVPASHRDFNLTWIDGDKLDAKDLRAALTQLPFSGPYRVLRIDSAGDLKKKKTKSGKDTGDSKEKDEAIDVLRAYLKNPNPALRLLLLDSRKRLKEEPLKELLSELISVDYQYLGENERIDWIINQLQLKGKRITDEAARYLMLTSTESLSELASKLDHAALYAGESPEIDILTVQRIAGITSKVSVFDLEHALHKGSLEESLRIARRLLEGGESVLKLVAYLHRSLILVWQIKAIPRSKDEDQELRRILGNRYFVRDEEKRFFVRNSFVMAAKVTPMPMIERALLGLLDLEITLKTRTVEEDILFYHWLAQVMTPKHRTPEPLSVTGS